MLKFEIYSKMGNKLYELFDYSIPLYFSSPLLEYNRLLKLPIKQPFVFQLVRIKNYIGFLVFF